MKNGILQLMVYTENKPIVDYALTWGGKYKKCI
jgi:hypothetical protein